jgi:hypothetical protein
MKNKTALRSSKYEMQDGPSRGRIAEREKTRGPVHTRHLTNLAFREENEAELFAFMATNGNELEAEEEEVMS